MEQWATIPGYRGRYRISDRGEVYSTHCKRALILQTSNRGYRACLLRAHGRQRWHYVHRLLAVAFIPNPQRHREVDHINRKRQDNRLANLRWVSVRQQQMNRGLHPKNTSGVPGVTRHPSGQWQARILKNTYLGIFPSLKHAIACRRKAERLING